MGVGIFAPAARPRPLRRMLDRGAADSEVTVKPMMKYIGMALPLPSWSHRLRGGLTADLVAAQLRLLTRLIGPRASRLGGIAGKAPQRLRTGQPKAAVGEGQETPGGLKPDQYFRARKSRQVHGMRLWPPPTKTYRNVTAAFLSMRGILGNRTLTTAVSRRLAGDYLREFEPPRGSRGARC